MARYIAEDKKLLKILQSSTEEEEINRRLKAAGLYDHEDTYEARRQLDEVLQKSKEESVNRTRVDLASRKSSTSFEDAFNIVDDDEDIVPELSPPVSTSTKKNGRKPPQWKPLSDDDHDDEDLQANLECKAADPLEGTSNLVPKNHLNLQKGKPVDAKKLVLTAKESYGSKMVAASLKKGEENKSLSSDRLLRPKRGDLIITPDELSDAENVPEIEPLNMDISGSASKDEEATSKSFNSEDDDFTACPASKNNQNRGKPDSPGSGWKSKIGTMRALCNKYSEMLKKIEQITPSPLPEELDFENKGPYQQLIENEEKSKIDKSSCSRPIKWGKPIILTMSNNKRRRQMFKKSQTNDTSLPVDTKIDQREEIICDSPPASSSTFRLDIPPTSPVFESSASRKRLGGSKEITEMGIEIGRKSPVDATQDSSFQECPICGKSFPLSVIETHADGCINNLEEEARPRSERIAARSVKSRNGWHDSSQWGKGLEPTVGRSTPIKPEMDAIERIFDSDSDSGSDFETTNGSGAKRNQRKTEGSKVKKRRF
ncbi:uncharacterized protein LOC130685418 [Daphnia carinata]|uniref:uncharacterized protein LOC130685418 n=1 Tax=Daphnia carinata TaxID=120202 RepID=UPI00257CF722|nr:uncharacterized protein LOC130685418 [Daphnia carinata]